MDDTDFWGWVIISLFVLIIIVLTHWIRLDKEHLNIMKANPNISYEKAKEIRLEQKEKERIESRSCCCN